MKKNILFLAFVFLVLCIGIGAFLQQKQVSMASAGYSALNDNPESKILEEYAKSPIGYSEYAGLYTLKQIVPAEIYRECVLPPMQELLAKNPVTRGDFAKFERQVDESLKKKGFSLNQEMLAFAQKESLGASMKKTLDLLNENANELGQDLQKGLEQFLDDFNRQFIEPKNTDPQNKDSSNSQAMEL